MVIWVDVDVCLNVIKEILFCVVEWIQILLMLVVNQLLCVLLLCFICILWVEQGFDVVDNEIVCQCVVGDLVIIVDILLVVEVLVKGGVVLNLCGECYSEVMICEWLMMWDFMEILWVSGVQIGGLDSLLQCDW